MDNSSIGSNNRSASVPPKLKALKTTVTNSPTIDAKTFFNFLDSYANPPQGTSSFFRSNRDPKDLITMANKFTLADAAAAEDPGTMPDAQQLRIATAITAGKFGDPIPEVVAMKLKGILTFFTVPSAKTTIETAIKPGESGRVTATSIDRPPTPPITMSSTASTGQFPLLDLPDGALFKHFDSLDIRRLVQFSTSSKEALSLVKRYLALPDTTVDLSDPSIRDKITDDSLKLFSECKHINLSYCRNITDAGLAYLKQARDINLFRCNRITDAGLAHLSQARDINLSCCRNITDAGLAYLTQARDINLSGCHNITDAGLAHLKEARDISLSGCRNITDAGLAYLSQARVINLIGCRNITDAGLAYLTQARDINLEDCEQITDAGLAHLKQARHINLSFCENITDEGLAHLTQARDIDLMGCNRITDAGLAQFKILNPTCNIWGK
jgi:hypothetical protein